MKKTLFIRSKKITAILATLLVLSQPGFAMAETTEIIGNGLQPPEPVLVQEVTVGSSELPSATSTIQQLAFENADLPVSTTTPIDLSETASTTPPLDLPAGENTEQSATTSTATMLVDLPTDETASSSTETTLQNALDQAPAVEATTTASSTVDIEIINTNDIVVLNEAEATATSGDNSILSGDEGEQAAIDTGDVNVYANVLNVVNTNLVNSKIVEMVENFNALSADILLNNPEVSSAELAQDLITQICTEVSCQSLSSFTLTNNNTAAVGNNIKVSGDSGNNTISGVKEDATIKTGDVKAVVNVLNIVNTNLVNSRWTIATINVFGDWTGDLVLPSELYFQEVMTLGANTQQADLEDIKKVVININNDNQAEIINNVNTDAQSGGNAVVGEGEEDGTGGDVEDSQIETGDAQSASNVQNFANTNIFNGRWYLGIINTLGAWSGNIYSLPDQVAMAQSPTGLMFFSSSAQDEEALKMFEDTMAAVQDQSEDTVNIQNQNDALIVNNVDVLADTGANLISAEETENAKIKTGNAYALANILNFANTNLVNADLQVGLVNVFGKWNGNIVFGYPDLAVSQKMLSEKFPKEPGRPAAFELDFSNIGQASMAGSKLEWQFDPKVLSFLSISQNLPYSSNLPGLLIFELGKINPQNSGKIEVLASTAASLAEGDKISVYARIFGAGPERNKANNESLLEVFAATTGEANDGNGSEGSGNNGGGGGGNNGGSGGSGGGQPSSPLKIQKTNNAGGTVAARSTVTFTLTVDNDSSSRLQNVIIYDTLRGPDNSVISEKTLALGDMAGMEEAVINYDLYIPASAEPGQYTNSAYVEGLNSQLSLIKSDKTAISQFTVGGDSAGQGTNGQQQTGQTGEDGNESGTVALLQMEDSEEQASSTPQFLIGEVKGAKTERTSQAAAVSAPSPLEEIAGIAQAGSPGDILVPFQEAAEQQAKKSELSRWLNLLLLIFLIAFGYASANMISRMRKAQALEDQARMMEIISPVIPAIPLKRRTRKPITKKPLIAEE